MKLSTVLTLTLLSLALAGFIRLMVFCTVDKKVAKDNRPTTPRVNLPPTMTMTELPNSIVDKGVTLKWNVMNVTECKVLVDNDSAVQIQPVDGEYTVYPTKTTTYRLVCEGLDGSSEDSVTVVVNERPAPTACHGSSFGYLLDLPNIVCKGWSQEGIPQVLANDQPVPDGVCAITCQDDRGAMTMPRLR